MSNIQLVNIQPDDVIIIELDENAPYDTCSSMLETIADAFPDNKILVAYDCIKNISVLRHSNKDWSVNI